VTEDYMIFGYGWNGEVKESDPNLAELTFLPKNPVQSVRDEGPTEGYNVRKVTEKVNLIQCGDYYYHVVCDVIPDAEDISTAVARYRPRPAPHR